MAMTASSSRLLATSRVVTSGRRNLSQLRTPNTSGIVRINAASPNLLKGRPLSTFQDSLLASLSTLESSSAKAEIPASSWTAWEVLASTLLAMAMSGSLLLGSAESNSHHQVRFGPPHSGGNGGGGPSSSDFNALLIASPAKDEEHDRKENSKLEEEPEWIPWQMNVGQKPYEVSTRTDQGDRTHMEDEYLIKEGGRFAAVFDGHGGSDVSRYLRQNLYSKIQDQRKTKQWEDHGTPRYGSLRSHITALRRAFEQVDREVCAMDHMSHQGSTAVAVSMHEEKDGRRFLLSANVGDSRAVLCRNGGAVDLTRDHKPNSETERARLEAMGEQVEFDMYGQCWRVRNLSLSRAIGDRMSKPAVTGQVEIQQFPVMDGDEFIILGSDGLWDVMTSQDAVSFVRNRLNAAPNVMDGHETDRIAYARRMTMSKELIQEALKLSRKFGPAADNICVVVVWLPQRK